jgi:Fe-S-cluster-containing hydrogenase component 2
MPKYLSDGILSTDELLQKPTAQQLEKGVALCECVQQIPCNPCVDACPVHAISMADINAPPFVDFEKCTTCGKCVGVCPGLAIFLVKVKGGKAQITLPYEFLPVPVKGDVVEALDRAGSPRGKATVVRVTKAKKTAVVTIEVDASLAMDVRNIAVRA